MLYTVSDLIKYADGEPLVLAWVHRNLPNTQGAKIKGLCQKPIQKCPILHTTVTSIRKYSDMA